MITLRTARFNIQIFYMVLTLLLCVLYGSYSGQRLLPDNISGLVLYTKPDFMTTAQDRGKAVSLTHRPPLPKEMLLVLISVRG